MERGIRVDKGGMSFNDRSRRPMPGSTPVAAINKRFELDRNYRNAAEIPGGGESSLDGVLALPVEPETDIGSGHASA